MASLITLKGIDQAISNLNYQNEKSLKYRLVSLLRQLYEDERSIESLQDIGADKLIEVLWGIADDPDAIKKKRKNLSRIKYSVNVDLKVLYREGRNPEGIIIGPTNTFTMSDEAKDRALNAFLADKIGGEEADADGAEIDYGILEETGSDQEVMNEDDILQAIKELDENYPIGDLETLEPGDELGDKTLAADLEEIETPQKIQTVSTPPKATGEADSEAEQASVFTQEMGDEEGLGEITFDPEETQYLTVPEDGGLLPDVDHGDAQAGVTASHDTMDDEQALMDQPDFLSTADSKEKPAQPEYPESHAGKEALGKGAKKKKSPQIPASGKKAKRAIKQMEEALARRPDDIDLLQQLAQAKETSGDLQAALSLYQKIIELSPGEDLAEEACLRLSLKLLDEKE